MHQLFTFILLILVCILSASPTVAAVNSSSILFDQTKTRIYSANFDAGSVSIIDAASGKILKEATIGRDIRRLALSDGEKPLLLVSDYLSEQLILMDADTLTIKKQISTPSRPFAVLFNTHTQLFYALSFEESHLLVLDKKGEILTSLETAPTPRGLALTDDQRLLVTHSMTGQVSIYDVKTSIPVLNKVLQLADSEAQEDRKVSQGKPRLLDNIAISPDGETAWLPHVLWSFADDFQFQSTIFPAVSILDLSPGEEQEIVDERKQLFQQINVIENANKTRIVSNPHEAVFTEKGDKVIISLAGSEDLMVFDLSRQSKGKSKRHRRKKSQGGAKVTQIYRNVPGDNPRGLLIKDRNLFVQNAMSLSLASFDIGQPGPFARVKLDQENFAKLVSNDPVPALTRLGKTLFNRANTDDNPESPMAGDFWMSCNSCHLDGFNFTNKFLMETGKKDRFSNAVTGHVDSYKMIAGNPVAAYIDIIQKTQGGMDNINMFEPPLEVAKMMSALNDYVRAPENLPYLSTWLRLDAPERYTHPEEWVNSAKCADCHSTIYEQWADSNHGMNMDHPFYRFQEDLAAKEEGEEFRTLCRGCHAPQMVLNNDQGPLKDYGDMYDKNSQTLIDAHQQKQVVSERGTGCLFCHRITKAEDAGGNADLTVNLKDRQEYIFEDTKNDILQWLADVQINASPLAHKISYSQPDLYQSSLYCATCHNEFTPGMGANINDNFGEWLASPFNRPDDPSQHKTCIDCHMTQDVTDFDNKVAGISTDNGPTKKNLRSHHFTGGNYYLTGMRNPEHKKMSIDILKTALTLDVQKKGNALHALVTNKNSGHDMPGGSRRQVWLEVIIKDKHGKTVYENGVIEDGYIPKDSRKFIKVGVDKEGEPVGLRFWRYVKIGKDTRIKSGETRTEIFELPEDIDYPIEASTRVLYQVFSKAMVEQIQSAYPDQKIPVPEVIEMVKLKKVYQY
jgi:DNA-binding beta-propeller fold protein YncE